MIYYAIKINRNVKRFIKVKNYICSLRGIGNTVGIQLPCSKDYVALSSIYPRLMYSSVLNNVSFSAYIEGS